MATRLLACQLLIAGQPDVVPAEWSDVSEQRIVHGTALPESIYGPFEVNRIRERNRRDHEIQTAGSVPLIFMGAIPDLTEAMEEHRPRQRVPRLSFVQSASHTTPQRWIAKPFESEQGSLQSTVFSEPRRQAVLARIGGQFPQDQGGGHGSLLEAVRRMTSSNCRVWRLTGREHTTRMAQVDHLNGQPQPIVVATMLANVDKIASCQVSGGSNGG